MADGSFPSLVSKDRLPNLVTNPIFVNLSDGTDGALIDGSGNLQVILAANDGVDIGDVTVNNAAGAAAVNIQDGGNSITVDGTVAATQSGVWDIGTVTTLTGITNDVNIADGGNVISIDDAGGSITVDGTVTATNPSVKVDDSAFGIATDSVTACGFLADETAPDSVDEGDVGLARMTLDRKIITSSEQSGVWDIGTVTTLTGITNDVNIADGGNSITVDGTVAATQSGVWDIGTVTTLTGITNDVNIADGGNSITVDASQLDIDDLNATDDNVAISDGTDTLAVNTDGSINVNVVSAVVTGEVHDYDTASAVASDASDNHDYATANSTFLLKSVIVSGSGNIKFEVQTGPVASLATVAVGFLTGRQGDTKQLFFDPPIEVPATSTGTTRIIRTNRQGAATDLYSTIIGLDI